MGDSFAERIGSVFDPVADALQKTVAIYSQIEAIKLNNQLAKAQASANAINNPTPTQDAQARAQSSVALTVDNRWIVGAAVLVSAAALYVIVK